MSNTNDLPLHIGIIMDGNRRWAKNIGKNSEYGHRAGYRRIIETVKLFKSKGIKYLTVYAFSTENWKRDNKEIDSIMKILQFGLKKDAKTLHDEGIKFRAIGKTEDLGKNLQQIIIKTENLTKNNKEGFFNVALSYGGRNEIVESIKKIIESDIGKEDICEATIEKNLDTAGLPDPNLIIRCGGQHRLSNFLLWQSAYSELYFTEKYWPEFEEADLDKAISWYKNINRNFGA